MQIAVIQFTKSQDAAFLGDFAEDVQTGIRNYLRRHHSRTGRLAKSIKAQVYGREVIVESDVPYAKDLDQGTHTRKTMWHLINRVIPLKLNDGRTIFRRVTLESIRRGKWQPGPREGVDYVRRGVELAKSSGSSKGDADFRILKPRN